MLNIYIPFLTTNSGIIQYRSISGYAVQSTIPIIPFIHLQFHLVAKDVCKLPKQKGSLLRGGIGRSLRRTVCVNKEQKECKSCYLQRQCIYTRFFETFFSYTPTDVYKNVDTSARPFVISNFDETESFAKNQILQFSISMFGKPAELFPYIIFSIEKMCYNGLYHKKAHFQIDSIYAFNPLSPLSKIKIFDGYTRTIIQPPSYQKIESIDQLEKCTIHFRSPTHIKYANRVLQSVTPRQLVSTMLLRARTIAQLYTDQVVDWTDDTLKKLADNIEVTHQSLKWQQNIRYSSRQKSKMKLEGFIGSLELKGPLKPFSLLFKQAQILHVGSNTVFGCGRIEIK